MRRVIPTVVTFSLLWHALGEFRGLPDILPKIEHHVLADRSCVEAEDEQPVS